MLGPRFELAQRTSAAGRVTGLMTSISRLVDLLTEWVNVSAAQGRLDSVRGTAAASGDSFACCGVGACGMGLGCHAEGGFQPALGSIPRQVGCPICGGGGGAHCALAVLACTLSFIYFCNGRHTSTQPIRKPFYSQYYSRSRAVGEPFNIPLRCWLTRTVAAAHPNCV